MGSNRIINSNEEKTEIQQPLIKEFNVSTETLYDFWKGYVSLKIKGEKRIIPLLRKENKVYNQEASDYFAALGLELFSKEYEQEAEKEIEHQKELDFGK